jgi:hypothetical protein
MGLSLEAAQVNPKFFVFGHERMLVHGRSNSSAANGSANGFSMVHQAVKVGGAEPPCNNSEIVIHFLLIKVPKFWTTIKLLSIIACIHVFPIIRFL